MGSTYGSDRPGNIPQGIGGGAGDWDEDEVKAIVQRELDEALGQDGGSLSQDRLQALKYYEGELPLPVGTDRSNVVMRSVLEAVEWVLPALMRIFTASDRICIVEPPRPGMEQAAKQATEYVNHIFERENPGFMILHDWFKDALLERLGWVKYWADTQRETETQSYTGLVQPQLDALLGEAEVEIVKERRYKQPRDSFGLDLPFPPPPQQPQAPMVPGMPPAPPLPPPEIELIDVTLRFTREFPRVRIENVAPEEILFSRRAKRGDIPFLAHRRRWTYSDLVEQGYDEDTLDLVPLHDDMEMNIERVERFRADDLPPYQEDAKTPSRHIWVEECYVQLSKDGSTTELYQVMTAGHGLIILTRDGEPCIECVDEVPFVSITPIPQSHRLVGLSLADLTADLQEIKSSIMRQMVDNAYLSNWPRIEVADDSVNENTFDDLLTLRPGGIVRSRRLGGIQAMSIPYTADKSFPLVQYIDETQEIRTGVARQNNAISPDALSNTTAAGLAMAQGAQAQRVELFARIFAHGVEQLMRGILGLVRKHQQQERIIRVTGGWLNIDPREWREAMPVTVSVGLGTGNRDQILTHLMTVVQLQNAVVQQQGGPKGPLVYAQNVYDALKALQENAGFKQSFFADPSQPPPPGAAPPGGPPPPDPGAMQAQAAVQATQIKAQAAVQAVQMKAQADAAAAQQKAGLEAQLAQQKQQHQMMLEQQKQSHEMELEQQKAQHDLIIARAKVEAEAAVKQREVELKFAAGAYAAGQGGGGPAVGNGGLPGL
jgi:hypothetical protein